MITRHLPKGLQFHGLKVHKAARASTFLEGRRSPKRFLPRRNERNQTTRSTRFKKSAMGGDSKTLLLWEGTTLVYEG